MITMARAEISKSQSVVVQSVGVLAGPLSTVLVNYVELIKTVALFDYCNIAIILLSSNTVISIFINLYISDRCLLACYNATTTTYKVDCISCV